MFDQHGWKKNKLSLLDFYIIIKSWEQSDPISLSGVNTDVTHLQDIWHLINPAMESGSVMLVLVLSHFNSQCSFLSDTSFNVKLT